MRTTTLILSLALLSAGNVIAQEEPQEEQQEAQKDPFGHLEKGKSGFRETWVHPTADFTKYDSLYLWDATFEYRDVGPARRTRSTMMNTRQREFGISDADRRKFEEVTSEAFVKEVQRAKKFEIADEIGPGTIIMRAAILDIISRVPPEFVGRADIFLASVGEATLVMELIDATDGEILAVVAERRILGRGRIDDFSLPTNRATVIAEVRRWARRAANKLRTELDKAIAGK